MLISENGDFEVCSKCRRRPARPGKKTCEDCAAKERTRKKALYDNAKANGLCIYCCRAPALPGLSSCAKCAEKAPRRTDESNRRHRSRYQNLRKAGLCVSCGKQRAEPGKSRCRICAEAYNALTKEARQFDKAHGICTVCHKRPSIPGLTRCVDCTQRDYEVRGAKKREYTPEQKAKKAMADKARRQARRAAGLCISCGTHPAVKGYAQCSDCRAKDQRRRMEKSRGKPAKSSPPYDARYPQASDPPKAGLKYYNAAAKTAMKEATP